MPLATTQVNSDGVDRRAYGSFSGTYTAANQTINLGWKPKYFRIRNLTDGLDQSWQEGMNKGDFIEHTWSTGVETLQTDDQLVVNDDGTVNIVAAGGAMTDNDTVIWEARG